MKMGLAPVNYSTWQHILCSKVETGEDVKKKKKIRRDRLHKTSQRPFIFLALL